MTALDVLIGFAIAAGLIVGYRLMKRFVEAHDAERERTPEDQRDAEYW